MRPAGTLREHAIVGLEGEDVKCTWRGCGEAAAQSFANHRGRRWAYLCAPHANQIKRAAASVGNADASPWIFFRMSIKAAGGWLTWYKMWM